jgi:hypothetical protein
MAPPPAKAAAPNPRAPNPPPPAAKSDLFADVDSLEAEMARLLGREG